jgi:GDP-4-dehydro-6-deoxy-D-mannose reductase
MGSAAESGAVTSADNPISESQPINPVSVYGLTKSLQTQLASYYAQLGVNVSVCRIFNLNGPGISESLFIGRLQKEIQEVLGGRKHHIELGSLNATRDYINVEQAAQQIIDIAIMGRAGEVYNVASGVPIKISEVLEQYLKDHKLPLTIVRSEQVLGNHTGYDVPVIYADITKTRSLTKKYKTIK